MAEEGKINNITIEIKGTVGSGKSSIAALIHHVLENMMDAEVTIENEYNERNLNLVESIRNIHTMDKKRIKIIEKQVAIEKIK